MVYTASYIAYTLKNSQLKLLVCCIFFQTTLSMNQDSITTLAFPAIDVMAYCMMKAMKQQLIAAKQELIKNPQALFEACDKHDINKLKLLIIAGAPIDARNENCLTTLHQAAIKGCLHAVDILLHCGASLSAQTRAKETPLHKAVYFGHMHVLEALISKSFFMPDDTQKRVTQSLKECCMIEVLINEGLCFLKNNILLLLDWSADYIADQVSLNKQRELIQAWRQQNTVISQQQLHMLFDAHKRRHLVKVQHVLELKNAHSEIARDLAQKYEYGSIARDMAQFLDHIAQASLFEDLKGELQEAIAATVKHKLRIGDTNQIS